MDARWWEVLRNGIGAMPFGYCALRCSARTRGISELIGYVMHNSIDMERRAQDDARIDRFSLALQRP